MSVYNKPLSLTDRQLIHRLYHEYNYTQKEVADIVGCSRSVVAKILRQDIQQIEEEIAFHDTFLADSGCYRTSYHCSEDSSYSYMQDISEHSDPVLEQLIQKEEGED